MNVILLSGGSGKRLWPISNGVRSKQFLKIFDDGYGHKESMAQRMVRMIKKVSPDARITVAAPENQIHQIIEQIGNSVDVSIEPTGRDTFPAIVLASAFLRKNGVGLQDAVVVCPVDQYVEEDYFQCLSEMSDNVRNANLTLMGIEPSFPSDKYGYILPANKDHISSVLSFKEKPGCDDAKSLISEGALWNGGVFAFKLGYLLDIAEKFLGTSDFDRLHSDYSDLKRISFDFAVVEKERDIDVIRFGGQWQDLGTWDSLAAIAGKRINDNVISDECEGTEIINELPIPLVSLGIKDSIIVASPDGILVCKKEKTSSLKSYVPDSSPMFEERLWGDYHVIKSENDGCHSCQICYITVTSENTLKLLLKGEGESILTVASGKGSVIIDNKMTGFSFGDSIRIKTGQGAVISAVSDLSIMCVRIDGDFCKDIVETL